MTTFIQFHTLIAYPACNLNRDDSGRPKTMMFGGVERLRVSSQSEKRALRTSPIFKEKLKDVLGTRAQSFGSLLSKILIDQHQMEPEMAERRAAEMISHDRLGKLKIGGLLDPKSTIQNEELKKYGSSTEQLAFLSPEELNCLQALAERIANGDDLTGKEMLILKERPRAADIALFGRMLADNPGFNVEASCQVSHAFTTHRAIVEDDYFTAIDEIKAADNDADRGAGFIGVQEFGAGTFYLYVCLDANQLVANLAGDKDLAAKTAAALTEALALTSPSGKQNAFASRSRAEWMLVEVGDRQPRTLGTAFQKPIQQGEKVDVVEASIHSIHQLRKGYKNAYGQDWTEEGELNVRNSDSQSLADLIAMVERAVHGVINHA